MRADVIECADCERTLFVVDVYDDLNWLPVHTGVFLNEFAAQTYADAINIGVVKYEIKD